MSPLFCFGGASQTFDLSNAEILLSLSVLGLIIRNVQVSNLTAKRFKSFEGCLLGMAVGDSIGLPYEGLSAQRGRQLFNGDLRQRLILHKGLCSDDTDHACMTAQALLSAGDSPAQFAHTLAWKLRWWILGLPAGIGMATLKSCLKLWIGFSPDTSGVYSAGNGPAMRSPILGVYYGAHPTLLAQFVRASTRLTHTDPKAERGALLIALAAHCAAASEGTVSPLQFHLQVNEWIKLGILNDESMLLINQVVNNLDLSPEEFRTKVLQLEKGVTGYIDHTVSMAIYLWLKSKGNYTDTVTWAIQCGGDTDTLAAIAGAITGAGRGVEAIPAVWLGDLWEFPRSKGWISRVAKALSEANGSIKPEIPISIVGLMIRNIVFIIVVLVHGIRRLAPPY